MYRYVFTHKTEQRTVAFLAPSLTYARRFFPETSWSVGEEALPAHVDVVDYDKLGADREIRLR
jgi:hypothetical protein